MAEFGPDTAELTVHTHRDGVAAAAGHDLVLLVGRWSATLDLAANPAVELTADPASMEVRSGSGGAKPLSDKDRRDIRSNLLRKVLGEREVRFRSTAVQRAGAGRQVVRGDLTLAGTSRPASFELEDGADGRVTATALVRQSDWGIRPYSALFGALKVADEVEVRLVGRPLR